MLAILLAVALLQQTPDPAVQACLAGGGAAGVMSGSTGQGARRHDLAGGDSSVRLMVTILRLSARDRGVASLYADDRVITVRLREGHAQVVSGRAIWFSADPDVEIRYCLRVVS